MIRGHAPARAAVAEALLYQPVADAVDVDDPSAADGVELAA
jgi:hypothetical protein